MEDCKIEIKLEDNPGELSRVLDILAKNKANLISVSHIREKKTESSVPVIITFEATSEDFVNIINDLEEKGIEISEKRIGGSEEVQITQEFILIGHVIDTDIKETIYAIYDKGVIVKRFEVRIKAVNDPSSAFVKIGAKDQKTLDAAMKTMAEIAKKKDLLLISGIQT
jgi:ACT domain-containing protein